MSGALTAVSTLATFGLPAIEATGLLPAWIRQGRKIRPTSAGISSGVVIPDVTIEEQHEDRVQVTQHPVAFGSPISDHAYKLPNTVTMRCGWSNANLVGAIVGGAMMPGPLGGLTGGLSGAWSAFTEQRAREIYMTLLAFQGTIDNPPILLDITTGKRDYTNMVLTEMSVRTDHMTEYALIAEMHFQEVFIVQTSRTTVAPTQSAADDKTKPTEDTPPVQPDEKPERDTRPHQLAIDRTPDRRDE